MCKLINSSLIVPRLRIAIEQLFQVNNQTTYIGLIHHPAEPLTRCMGNCLHCCIDDLGQILKEIEPKKIDTGCLTLEDTMILEGYAEIRRGLIKSWQFIETRERAILKEAQAIAKGAAQ
jgi:hypothetical protein